MKTAMTDTHTSGDLTLDVSMARQQPQPAYSTPGMLIADILLEGTASATAPVTMESNPAPDQALGQAPIRSYRANQR
jgi:hypothetical protein